MAKLDTNYYLLSQSQLYAMLVDVVALCDSYQEDCTPQEAMEMAVADVFYGLGRYVRKSHRLPPFSKLRYWIYKKRVWRKGLAALEFDEWVRDIQHNISPTLLSTDDPLQSDQDQSFIEAVKPVMAWLSKHKNPHAVIVIDSTHANLLEGIKGYNTQEFIKD